MGNILRLLLRNPLLRPAIRFVLGMVAIPTFRLFLRKVVRLQDLDEELEKDLEQWFRASLILLAATANMEELLFGWFTGEHFTVKLDWIVLGGRILLAVGVIETMPDQELFAIIHPGPPKLKFRRGEILQTLKDNWRDIFRGLICQHINRTAPVFAILATIFDGPIGWIFYLLAITQYLIMGLVTSRDHAMDVLGEFDKQVNLRRRELMDEFDLDEEGNAKKSAEGADAQETNREQTLSDSKSDSSTLPTYRLHPLLLTVIIAVAFAAITATVWWVSRPIPFHAERWKAEPQVRAAMIDDLIADRMLLGKTRAEIEEKLGKPQAPDTIRDGNYIYLISSDGVLDDLWLEVQFENDRVIHVRYYPD